MNIDTNKLKIAMANRIMNCTDLAKSTGLSLNTISEYASGKRSPTTKSLGKIARVLNVDVTELIEG